MPEFYAYYTSLPYRDWNVLFGFPAVQKISIVIQNAIFLLIDPAWMMGFHAPMLWPLLLVVGVLVVIGFVMSARRSFGVIHLFVVMYVGTLLLWAWPPARFLMTVYPLFLYYAAIGGLAILGRITLIRVRMAVVKVAIVLIGFTAGWGSGKLAREAVEKGIVCIACDRDWQDFRLVMSSIDESTPPDAILMGTQDPMLYLYTGRKAIRLYDVDPVVLHYSRDPDREPFGPPERLAERMAKTGVDYLVLTRRGRSLEDDFLWSQFLALKRARPGLLEPTMIVGSPDFGLYRVNRDLLVNP